MYGLQSKIWSPSYPSQPNISQILLIPTNYISNLSTRLSLHYHHHSPSHFYLWPGSLQSSLKWPHCPHLSLASWQPDCISVTTNPIMSLQNCNLPMVSYCLYSEVCTFLPWSIRPCFLVSTLYQGLLSLFLSPACQLYTPRDLARWALVFSVKPDGCPNLAS